MYSTVYDTAFNCCKDCRSCANATKGAKEVARARWCREVGTNLECSSRGRTACVETSNVRVRSASLNA